ncbi:Regulator of nucleoside diphosphate kinase [Novipirellula aureliae]|uniref:Regulator of nucleoside diphosphate kinase n=2 Tax=Novipirellula aureliae TaxID=2527966 RepID=A0A5C6DYF1_9BACT|nr:GreA/GreB family elongation factor [Novipirellula aureliae]TWU40076.1 Regulator of nucleoside diphosphate kinase [Novipirellula aureliae]
MYSTVRVRDLKEREEDVYTLVYPRDAKLAEGKISILAPIGTALLGYRVGDIVRWEVPGGPTRLKIEEMIYKPNGADLQLA